MEYWVLIVPLILLLIPAGIWVTILIRSYQLERDVELVIDEYRSKLSGSNRFLFDESLMRLVFPEYSEYVIHRVWGKLVKIKAIERDTMDGSWCIK